MYPSSGSRSITSTGATIRFSDLDASDGWAKEAIRWVAATNDWMQDYAPNDDGSYPFHPARIESRKHLARAIVKVRAVLGPNSSIGEEADIGHEAGIDAYAKVGARAVVPVRGYVPPRKRVAEGTTWGVPEKPPATEKAAG